MVKAVICEATVVKAVICEAAMVKAVIWGVLDVNLVVRCHHCCGGVRVGSGKIFGGKNKWVGVFIL